MCPGDSWMSRLLGGTSGRISMSVNVSSRPWHSGKRLHREDVEAPLEEPKRQPQVLICTNANASIKWTNQLVFTSVSGGRSFLETVARMPVRSGVRRTTLVRPSGIDLQRHFLNENPPSRIQEVESGGVHSMNPITLVDIRRCRAECLDPGEPSEDEANARDYGRDGDSEPRVPGAVAWNVALNSSRGDQDINPHWRGRRKPPRSPRQDADQRAHLSQHKYLPYREGTGDTTPPGRARGRGGPERSPSCHGATPVLVRLEQ
ncbi:hypothetical protein EDB80DRAFT_779156 [Ilyonectria destructans]|nr:hypothetical protein EDB80DRAFT_779156 [Ilyonectria destructans]